MTVVCALVKYEDMFVPFFLGMPTRNAGACRPGIGEYGESPEQAAIREAYEETGMVVEIDAAGLVF